MFQDPFCGAVTMRLCDIPQDKTHFYSIYALGKETVSGAQPVVRSTLEARCTLYRTLTGGAACTNVLSNHDQQLYKGW